MMTNDILITIRRSVKCTFCAAFLLSSFPSGVLARPVFQKGMCLAHVHREGQGYGSSASYEELKKLQALGVEWVSLTPFGYQERVDTPGVSGYPGRPGSTQWFSDYDHTLLDAGILQAMKDGHALGMHVMLKPHIWVSYRAIQEGDWTGTIAMRSEQTWKEWFQSYTAFILHYAVLASKGKAEIFVVGVELGKTLSREQEWRELIRQIRGVYRGQLTYAAGWEEFQTVPFWDALDYVGVNAYFPLKVSSLSPAEQEIIQAWGPHRRTLETISRTTGRPVIFTEAGYRSLQGTLSRPWQWRELDTSHRVSDENVQARAYSALLKVFWDEPWWFGVYWWKWTTAEHAATRDADRTDFYPVNKPAESVIRHWFHDPSPR
ncbi:MAG: hypothetical protein HYZ73_06475 [Elusimicrobia bacterium]|nr:hypothetical protein [Elusimicrobiota bacterium]